MTKPGLFTTILLCVAATGISTADGQTIDCTMKKTQSFEIDEGKSVGIQGASNEQFSISFTDLDSKNHTAIMVGNAGSERVSLIASSRKLTFVEITVAGNVTLTSIDTPTSGNMYAIHHRQIWLGLLGSGIITTYAGPCRRR